jgi:hypothetical protein
MRLSLEALIDVGDTKRFKTMVSDFIGVHMRNAYRIFLDVGLANTPIRTGFLRGSFREVARRYTNNQFYVPIYKGNIYYYHVRKQRTLKTPTSGTQFVNTDPFYTVGEFGSGFMINNEIRYVHIIQENLSRGLEEAKKFLEEESPKRFPKMAGVLGTARIVNNRVVSETQGSYEEIIREIEISFRR